MRAPFHCLPLALGTALLLGAGASAEPLAIDHPPAPDGAARAPVAADTVWLPTEPGRRWTYVYERERTRIVEGSQEARETLRGTRVDQVMGPAPEFGPETVLIESLLRGQVAGQPIETVERRRSFVESSGGGLVVLAREAPNPLGGEPELARFAVPLALLPPGLGVAQGGKWRVGVDEASGLRSEVRGEILGLQDAQTPAGLFEKCLVVRYTADIAGAIDLYGDRIEVREGRGVTTAWYAPGVGQVLAKEELDQTLELSNGSTIQVREQIEFALRELWLPAAPAAAPAPAPEAPADSLSTP